MVDLAGDLAITWSWCGPAYGQESIASLGAGFSEAFEGLVRHCLEAPLAHRHIPADFPLAGLDKAGLEAIEAGLEVIDGEA